MIELYSMNSMPKNKKDENLTKGLITTFDTVLQPTTALSNSRDRSDTRCRLVQSS